MENLHIDGLSGQQFEEYLVKLFKDLDYIVEHTPASNDYGADLIVYKNDIKTVIQAKRYSDNVGIQSVQEVLGAKGHYKSDQAIVITNSYFTPNAIQLAQSNDVQLWNRDKLFEIINSIPSNNIKKENLFATFANIINTSNYKNNKCNIPVILGTNFRGNIDIQDLTQLSNILIVGANNTGKSTFIHSIINGIINQKSSDEVNFLLIDSLGLEFKVYNNISHLIYPVIDSSNKALKIIPLFNNILEERYSLLSRYNVKNIEEYNNKFSDNKIPYIVIIIDEIYDIYIKNKKQFLEFISDINLKGNTVGIYSIASTKSLPIVNDFKSLFPSKIAFRVISQSDSRLILDSLGAEKIISQEEYILNSINDSNLIRYKSSLILDSDIKSIVLNNANSETYRFFDINDNQIDEKLLKQAVYVIKKYNKASTSFLQNKLKISNSEAENILDELENRSIISRGINQNSNEILIETEIKENVNIYVPRKKVSYLNPFIFNINQYIKSNILKVFLFPYIFIYYFMKIFLILGINIVIFIFNSFTNAE